jgi:hypothetical protein
MLINEEIIRESLKFSEEIAENIYDLMDEYNPCDFETDEDYAESIIDYVMGRMSYDLTEKDKLGEYLELFDIIMRNYGPFLIQFYNQICGDDDFNEEA